MVRGGGGGGPQEEIPARSAQAWKMPQHLSLLYRAEKTEGHMYVYMHVCVYACVYISMAHTPFHGQI